MLICLGIFMSAKTAHRASLIEWFFMARGMHPTGLHTKTAVPTQKIYLYKITIHSSWSGFPKAFGWYCCDYNTNPNFCLDKFNNISQYFDTAMYLVSHDAIASLAANPKKISPAPA